MNYRIIKYYIGYSLRIEAILMQIPLFCSIIYKESVFIHFLVISLFTFLFGFIISNKKPEDDSFYLAESFITVSFGWLALSIFGALPFFISREIPNYIDCLFETISSFTTTGASIVNNVEILSKSILLWRSFTHFLGGMGVLVLMLTIITTQKNNMLIMKAESPGSEVD